MDSPEDTSSARGIKRPHPDNSPSSLDNRLKTPNAPAAIPSTTFEPSLQSLDHSPESTYSKNEAPKDKSTRSLASSAFRNVSACNRCRLRKNRCDQRLPACKPCEKAGVKCTSYDPLMKIEIPRRYVYLAALIHSMD